MATITCYVDNSIVANAEGNWVYFYSFLKGVGEALPGIALTVATGGGSAIALYGSALIYSTSSAGQARSEALNGGYTKTQALEYEAATGVKEAAKVIAMEENRFRHSRV